MRQVILISGHSTPLKEIIFGAHSVPNFPTSFLRLVLVRWCHLVSWKYDSNDDVIMIMIPTSAAVSSTMQWKAELLDANHHVDIVRVRDDVQPHIRTLVLQPRREEWKLMELF